MGGRLALINMGMKSAASEIRTYAKLMESELRVNESWEDAMAIPGHVAKATASAVIVAALVTTALANWIGLKHDVEAGWTYVQSHFKPHEAVTAVANAAYEAGTPDAQVMVLENAHYVDSHGKAHTVVVSNMSTPGLYYTDQISGNTLTVSSLRPLPDGAKLRRE